MKEVSYSTKCRNASRCRNSSCDFDATSYRRFDPAVPKRGEFITIDGLRVKITGVKTNQDKSGRWPDNEWPRITVTGHYKPNHKLTHDAAK